MALSEKRSHARRIVLGLALLVMLACPGWFVGLVVVELGVEHAIRRKKVEILTSDLVLAETHRRYIQSVEERSGIRIVVDWPLMLWSGRLIQPDEPFYDERTLERARRASDAERAGWISFNNANQALHGFRNSVGDEVTWYVEGRIVVVTTEQRLPHFDASAKVREWWHAIEAWWNGP